MSFRSLRPYGRVALIAVLVASLTAQSFAGGFFRNGAVGGVIINAQGVLSQPSTKASRELAATMRDMVQTPDGAMNEASELRRVSLRKLSEMVADAAENNFELPSEVKYLAGLQRVQYVFVYPEQNDIVLAGPAEGA